MKKWNYSLLLIVMGMWLSGNTALADTIPPEAELEPGREFVTASIGDKSISGRCGYSKEELGYYDEKRHYSVFDWDTGFQLSWVTEKMDFSLVYVISYDGKSEHVEGGELEPLYYRYWDNGAKSPQDLRYEENPEADKTYFYPCVPVEYQYLKNSNKLVKVEYFMSCVDENTGEQRSLSFAGTTYFYGAKVENPTLYEKIPEGSMIIRVKQGDTLWTLAEQYLSDPLRYREIYEINRDRIINPDMIYENQVIYIPINKK